MNDPYEFLKSVGGRRLQLGGNEVWNFGHISSYHRTSPALLTRDFGVEQAQAEQVVQNLTSPETRLAEFKVPREWQGEARQSWNAWIIARYLKAFGKKQYHSKQVTGSCVGSSYGNLWWHFAVLDRMVRGDLEEPAYPFWPLTYGKGRQHAGMGGRGEGSLVEYHARAAVQDGILRADHPGVPAYRETEEGIVYPSSIEMQYSDGRAVPASLLEPAKKYTFVRAEKLTTVEQMLAVLDANGVIQHGSMWGGQMSSRVQGTDPPLLVNTDVTQWSHAMWTLDYIQHPTLGLMFAMFNNWGLKTHGVCPYCPLLGMVGWVKASEYERIILPDDTVGYYDQRGFELPTTPISWGNM